MRWRRGRDLTDGIEPVGPRYQRLLRLECQRGEMPIAGGDIRRIGDDQVEALRAERRAPAAMAPVDLKSKRYAIALGDDQRGSARLHRDHSRASALVFDGQRHRAAAGAQVGDCAEIALQGQLDELINALATEHQTEQLTQLAEEAA